MIVDTSILPRHVAKTVKQTLKTLPPQGVWQIIKKKDHYFLYDKDKKISCIANNASKPSDQIAKMIVRGIEKYIQENYA